MKTSTPRRELHISRLYSVSRRHVFRAWTDPNQLAHWWGPKDFTNPVCDIEARIGGRICIVMRAPDGFDYGMHGIITDVRANERLSFDFEALDKAGKPALKGRLSVSFADEGGKTRLSLSTYAEGLSPDAFDMLQGMETGWNQSLDRFARLINNPTQEKP